MTCLRFAQEMLENSERIAANKAGDDLAGWLDDIAHQRKIVETLSAFNDIDADNRRMRKAAGIIIEAFDKGIFVRSTACDNNPMWAIELLPYVVALKELAVTGNTESTEAEP